MTKNKKTKKMPRKRTRSASTQTPLKRHRLQDFTRGWLIGDFEPHIIRTTAFEFMVRHYSAGEHEARHVHKKADEISVIIFGCFVMNGETLVRGDIVHLVPGTAADFTCLEEGATAVIKMPSVKGDKYVL